MSAIRRLTLSFTLVAGVALALTVAACGDGSKPAPANDGGTPATDKPGTSAAESPETARALAAYDKGLDLLASKQKDGIWSVQGHPHAGFTGIAITPFLERPGGMRPADKAIADKALPWLASQLGSDGGVTAEFSSNYETSVVIMALAASKDAKYKADIDRAAAYIKKLQYTDESDPSYGGIGYGDDGPRSDLSNTQYALASLKAAGVPQDDPVFQRALTFLSRVQNRKENETAGEPTEWTGEDGKKVVRGNDGGGYYYLGESKAGVDERPDGVGVLRSYGSMTYALLRCYHLAGLPATDGRVSAAVDWISAHWQLDANPGMPAETKDQGRYYYYATIGKTLPAMGIEKIKAPGGKEIDWRAELSAKLLSEQKPDGSWTNTSDRWFEADPVLATAYALTALRPTIR